MTDRQRRFVIAYCNETDWDAKAAAEIAGYSSPAQAGWDNKRNPHVQRAISKHMEQFNQVGLAQKQMRIAKAIRDYERLDRYEAEKDKRIPLKDIHALKNQIRREIRAEVGDDIQRIEMNTTVTNTDNAKSAMAKALNLVDSIESEVIGTKLQA